MQDLGLHFLRHGAVGQRAGIQLVGPGEDVLAVFIHIVRQVAAGFHPEEVVEAGFDGGLDFGQALREGAGFSVAALHIEGPADGIVPEAVGFHLVALALGHGLAVDVGVHPAQSHAGLLGPEEAVVVEPDFRTAGDIALEHLLEELAVFLPGAGFVAGESGQLLHGLEEAQRRFHLVASVEEGIPVLGNQVGEDFLEKLRVALVAERQTGQGQAGFTHAAHFVPRKAGADTRVFVLDGEELLGSRLEAVVVVVTRHPALDFARELGFQAGGRNGFRGGGEHDALPFFERQLEETRHQQVFHAVETAAVFFLVHRVAVPVRNVDIVAGFGKLEVERGETRVQAERHAAFHRLVMGVGVVVGHGQFVDAAEGQIGLQPQDRVRMGVEQRVPDEQLVAAHHEQDFFLEEHTAHPVGDHRIGVHLKVHDVLVSPGLIHVPVAVDAEIERHAVLQQRLVERREEHVPVTAEPLDRDGHQAVIFAGVAAHDRRVAIAAGPVGREQFPFEGILEVHKLRFVELQICHFRSKLLTCKDTENYYL